MQKNLFPQWFCQLQQGFSIFLYGYGSKKRLIETFARKYLAEFPTVVVLGYIPHVSIKQVSFFFHLFQILDLIVRQVIGDKEKTFRTHSGQVEYIRSSFADPHQSALLPSRLFLLIHSLDGPSLRSFVAQSLLSLLAAVPQISLVASVDHLNASLRIFLSLTHASVGSHDATEIQLVVVQRNYLPTIRS